MSSSTSTSQSSGGGEGPSQKFGGSRVTSGKSANVRQSAAVQLQLKVIRRSVERLMAERKDLKEVKELLQRIMTDVDKDIEVVAKMRDLAFRAEEFQSGRSFFDEEETDMRLAILSGMLPEEEPELASCLSSSMEVAYIKTEAFDFKNASASQ